MNLYFYGNSLMMKLWKIIPIKVTYSFIGGGGQFPMPFLICLLMDKSAPCPLQPLGPEASLMLLLWWEFDTNSLCFKPSSWTELLSMLFPLSFLPPSNPHVRLPHKDHFTAEMSFSEFLSPVSPAAGSWLMLMILLLLVFLPSSLSLGLLIFPSPYHLCYF